LFDQRETFENQFDGMSLEPFTYADFENTRQLLLDVIQEKLTIQDRKFLLSVKNLDPDWSIYDFKEFPSIKWKLQNLEKLSLDNPTKYLEQTEQLKRKLDI